MPQAIAEPQETDGRIRRRHQSFDRAVDAVLDLIGEGFPSPTAQQIADRSGLSIRTVFRLTDDVEALHAAAVQRQAERTAPLYVTLRNDGPLPTRIRALVANRAAIFEAIAPVRRAGERLALGSTRIAEGIERHHALLRRQVDHVFAQEMSEMPPTRRLITRHAAEVACSWETWDQLRRTQGLAPDVARRVMEHILSSAVQTSREA